MRSTPISRWAPGPLPSAEPHAAVAAPAASPRGPGRRRGPAERTAAAFAALLACIAVLALHPLLYPGSPAVALGLGVAAVALGAWMAWSVQKQWRRELAAVSDMARSMAAGELTAPAQGRTAAAPEFAELDGALRHLCARMFRLVAQVRSGTAAVAATSGMLKADNAALSSRTEVQASSLEETASSTEELTSTVRQNADNARHASEVVAAATTAADEGAQAVARVVQSMDEIRERSRRIADIIGVIDGIAFQTNILALNAAVEAARAGEEGRGFAVVAGEVRSLAGRCASAAQEIRQLILGSVEQAETGSERVQAAGQAMEQILANVRQASGIVAEIAAASEEQSSGIEEINRAVVHIDGMTQQNAGLVEEVTRTVTTLQEEAEDLADAAAEFVLGAGEFGSAAEAAALVEQGAAFLRSHGTAALVAEVKKLKKGRFIDRDLYLSVWHTQGMVAAHGANRRLWNVDWRDFKDNDGRRFVTEIMEVAAVHGRGWMDYKWVHPVSKRTLVKTAYFEKCGDVVVSCGIYKQQQSGATPTAVPARRQLAA